LIRIRIQEGKKRLTKIEKYLDISCFEVLDGLSETINIWWPMPLFLDIYFIYRYRYNMEVDEEKIDTYNMSDGVCLWFCGLDVVLKLGYIGAVLM
jgi:hypothetical protein